MAGGLESIATGNNVTLEKSRSGKSIDSPGHALSVDKAKQPNTSDCIISVQVNNCR